jgi:hypothetical protein
MEINKNVTLTLDPELSDAWKEIAELKQISFSEFIKEVLAKEHLRYSLSTITESVRQISGTLPTQLEYKALRDEMIVEQLKDYENLS